MFADCSRDAIIAALLAEWESVEWAHTLPEDGFGSRFAPALCALVGRAGGPGWGIERAQEWGRMGHVLVPSLNGSFARAVSVAVV